MNSGINFERLYEYRFRDLDQDSRKKVWDKISEFLFETMGSPEKVLDPAAGRGEFICSVPAKERWAIDETKYPELEAQNIKYISANALSADLPDNYFDAIFVSNFLEHLATQSDVGTFLQKMRTSLKPGGRITILGPNFKYCAKEYFDCADHTLALTHVSVAEHLYAAGFTVERIVPRFLPYSFRGLLPPSAFLTQMYLKMPFFWPLLGKQFLLLGKK